MKILITGGGGYIGSNLKNLLIKKGHDVKTIGLNSQNIVCDITNFEEVKKHIKDYDVVYHLAGLILPKESNIVPHKTFLVNSFGTLNILEACRLNKIKKVIFTSTSKVYGKPKNLPISESQTKDPKSAYGYSKLIAEEMCENYKKRYNMEINILRLFNVYGPNQSADLLIPTMLKQLNNEEIKLQGNNSKMDFVYIDDVCNALKKCIDTNLEQPVNICTGNSYSASDIVEILEQITNKKIKLSLKDNRTLSENVGDNTLAKKLLNWEPTTNLKDGLTKILNSTKED